MKKYCSNCGQLLSPDAMFCGDCGTKIQNEVPKINENYGIDFQENYVQSKNDNNLIFEENDYVKESIKRDNHLSETELLEFSKSLIVQKENNNTNNSFVSNINKMADFEDDLIKDVVIKDSNNSFNSRINNDEKIIYEDGYDGYYENIEVIDKNSKYHDRVDPKKIAIGVIVSLIVIFIIIYYVKSNLSKFDFNFGTGSDIFN